MTEGKKTVHATDRLKEIMFIQASLTELILRVEETNKHSREIVERKQVM